MTFQSHHNSGISLTLLKGGDNGRDCWLWNQHGTFYSTTEGKNDINADELEEIFSCVFFTRLT